MLWFIAAVSVLIGIGRFFVPGHELSLAGSYEAIAHIWVGALLVLCFATSKGDDTDPMPTLERRINAVVCLVALTVLEVVMFLMR